MRDCSSFVLPPFNFTKNVGEAEGCQRLLTLWSDAFYMHTSGSGGRAHVTIFSAPSAVELSRTEKGAESGDFSVSLPSALAR